jgi:hypothetical protein
MNSNKSTKRYAMSSEFVAHHGVRRRRRQAVTMRVQVEKISTAFKSMTA